MATYNCGMFKPNRLFLAIVLLMSAAAMLWAQQTSTTATAISPAPRVTSVPPSASSPASAPAHRVLTGPLPKADTLEDGLKFTDIETTILSAVDDRRNQLDEACKYMLYRRAAALPILEDKQVKALGQPTVPWMKKNPEFFRGQPVRLNLLVHRVYKNTLAELGISSPWWPSNAPVWTLHCLNALAEKPVMDPMILFMVNDPMPALGQPEKVKNENGVQVSTWPMGKKVEVAALYYRNYTTENVGDENNSPTSWEYPVLIGWQMQPLGKLDSSSPLGDTATLFIGVLLAVLGLAWFYLRRRVSGMRRGEAGTGPKYQSLRDEEPYAQHEEDLEDVPVDESLRNAAEEFKKKRQAGDGTNRTS